ncbi:MAG: hypothetical protein JXR86_13410 [Spirochaetales bacterium]|nr:hypothetical protein [Spirochaetales bacterium]
MRKSFFTTVFTIITFFPLILGSCDSVVPDLLIPGQGIVKVLTDLEPDYDLSELSFVYIDPSDGSEYRHALVPDSANSSASLNLLLPAGNYQGYIIQDKEWDDTTGCRLFSETATRAFTVVENEETDLPFDNNWLTGTHNLTVNIDVSSMIAEGVTPDHAGIWMSSISADGEAFNHYHFHATELDGTILSGSFSVQPGEYDFDIIPSNFDHRDWTADEPWHRELSAGNPQTIYTVGETTASLDIQTIHFIEDDFSGDDSVYFTGADAGGTIEYVNGELHMAGNGEDSVPHVNLDQFAIENNMLIKFDFKLGTRNDGLNGAHPMLHVNMLDWNGPGDTRVFLTIDESGLWMTTHYDGVSTTTESWDGGSDYYNDGAYHTLYIFIRQGVVRVYNDINQDADITYVYDNRLQSSGGFSFECHQEIFIDNVRLEREILGNLPL